MQGLTLVTATGMRPEALSLCAGYVARFDWGGPLQWIIADDGDAPSEIGVRLPASVEMMRLFPRPAWREGQNTLARNLLAALPRARHDFVFFIEDDDWYSADYLREQMEGFAGGALIVGEVPARYYNAPAGKYQVLDNRQHASLCQTAIARAAIADLEEVCREEGSSFVDVRFWERCRLPRSLREGVGCVGIKGLPGRAGIGVGHRADREGWSDDPDGVVLRHWVGQEDAARLLGFKTAQDASGALGVGKSASGGLPSDPGAVSGPRNGLLDEDLTAGTPRATIFPPPGPTQARFEEFYFMGQLRYKCDQVWESGAPCEYDSYDLRAICEHSNQPHNRSGKSAPRAVQRASLLVDADGRPITYDETPPPEFSGARFREE